MIVTEKGCRIADKIIEILVSEKCTIEETQDIFSAVMGKVRKTSTVQMGETFTESYYE